MQDRHIYSNTACINFSLADRLKTIFPLYYFGLFFFFFLAYFPLCLKFSLTDKDPSKSHPSSSALTSGSGQAWPLRSPPRPHSSALRAPVCAGRQLVPALPPATRLQPSCVQARSCAGNGKRLRGKAGSPFFLFRIGGGVGYSLLSQDKVTLTQGTPLLGIFRNWASLAEILFASLGQGR